MKNARVGDLVTMNGNYYVSQEKRGKSFEVVSAPWNLCGTAVVKLKGVGSYALDGLDLVSSK